MKHIILLLVIITSICSGCREENCPEPCTLTAETGPCKAYFIRYYYDQTDGKCKEFVWGGCEGVVPFETLETCQECKCSTP